MDWEECMRKGMIKSASSDRSLILSLIESSEMKMRSQNMLPLNDITSGAKISLAYDSVREFLEAVAISKGYKIYNHDCFCAFIKEVLMKSDMGTKFDNMRKARNSINYYGRKFTSEESRKLLRDMEDFLDKLRNEYKL